MLGVAMNAEYNDAKCLTSERVSSSFNFAPKTTYFKGASGKPGK